MPSGSLTLAYDGTNKPETLATVLTGLVLDQDYEVYLSALNPYESEKSDPLKFRAAARPDAPGTITEIAVSRTGSSIGLQWTAPPSDGGSPILAYTLVQVIENMPDRVFYYGTSLSTTVAGLQSGESYSFKVKATNLVGDGPWSSVNQFLIVD